MGTVWDRTAEFLTDNIATVLPTALLAFFVPASIEGNFQAAMDGAGPGLILALQIVSIAFGLLTVWGTLAVTAMALDNEDSDKAGKLAGKRMLAALAVTLACFAALLLLVAPVPIVLSASGVDVMAIAQGRDFDLPAGIAAFVAIYLLVLTLLFLWLGARLILVTPVIVREGRWLSSLRQSWKLTRGVTWRVIGVIILFCLVSWVSILAANTVFGSVFALIAGRDQAGVSLAGVLTSIVVAAVQTGFTVLIPAFTAKLYLALTAVVGLGESPGRA
ncbi:MAG: glycerophosphoryl diester phosphodiesterase membrane domain-containing protein [Pseudomonadota bacterium]